MLPFQTSSLRNRSLSNLQAGAPTNRKAASFLILTALRGQSSTTSYHDSLLLSIEPLFLFHPSTHVLTMQAPNDLQPSLFDALALPPLQPLVKPPAPVPTNGAQSEHGGSGVLRTITVKPDGGVEFEVEGLKYPLKDKRGPKTVAALFVPALGWTEAHFTNPAIYTPQGLVVDWVKKERYYDVVRVHA